MKFADFPMEQVALQIYPVVIKIENMPFPEGYSVFDIRKLFAQQIIIDD